MMTPVDGEQCASLVYRSEWGWWEYAADYVTDDGGVAAMRRADSLEAAWGLPFSVVDRLDADGELVAYIVKTQSDPRPLAVRL